MSDNPSQFNCYIVDDNELDLLAAKSYVRKCPFLHISGTFQDAQRALAACLQDPPDVLFLDIDMPGLSGLELRGQLKDIPACVFITAFPEYAVESFEIEALDFIVKPLGKNRFDLTLQRLENYLTMHRKAGILDQSLGGDAVFIKEGHQQVKIQLHDVLYLEALKDYTALITVRKKYCVLSSLGNILQEQSFQNFIRIHRSYAVQKHFIRRITTQQVELDNITLPIGRSYRPSLEGLI